MISAIALDDEPPALSVIETFCGQVNFIDLQKTFSKTEDAAKYLRKYPVDLLFLDIRMPTISGIDFYKKLSTQVMVIFTTAYTEYAIEGFNVQAVDYLLKPYTFERFRQAIEKAREYYDFIHQSQNLKQPWLFIRANYSLLKIPIADILFAEGLDDYLKIHIRDQKPLVARMTMKSLLEKLPADTFMRVHRSYIVSFPFIDAVRNKMINIGDEEIPIGSSYESSFFARFDK